MAQAPIPPRLVSCHTTLGIDWEQVTTTIFRGKGDPTGRASLRKAAKYRRDTRRPILRTREIQRDTEMR